MKNKMYSTLAICAIICFSSCGAGKYEIKTEKSQGPSLGGYKTIFIGWLNLGPQRWKELGFKSQAQWNTEIRAVNVEWLHKAARSELSSKKLVLAQSPAAKPFGGGLAITFSNTKVERAYSAVHPYDYISTDIVFSDAKKGNTVYRCSLRASNRSFTPHNYRFESRLGLCAANIVNFIASKL